MDREAEAAQLKAKKGPTIRTVIMLSIVLVFVIFCMMNRGAVSVWPGVQAPLFATILFSFGGGLITGWLGNEQARRKRLKREG
jgi:uncharacterized integral membrane protein